MRLKELEQWLSELKGFGKPKIRYEQYATDAHLAARLLHVASTTFNDIEGKSVLDLGCGCGILSIGSMLLGSGANTGIDIDPDALSIFRENIDAIFDEDESGTPPLGLINGNVLDLASAPSFLHPDVRFDTVLLNPPFGTKDNAGIDMLFLQQAVRLTKPGGAVYSMHKSSTRDYVLKKPREAWGVGDAQVIAQLKFELPATYKFHKKEKVVIDVDLVRLQL